jgi:FtsH-binding integral membrane protein
MNENEKNLFYSVLKEKITEEPTPVLSSNIMYIVHKKMKKRTITNKIWEVLGYSLLITIPLVFVVGYLYFYSDFKFPSFHFSFEMPSKVYIFIIFIIFSFSLIELFFRRRLYEN